MTDAADTPAGVWPLDDIIGQHEMREIFGGAGRGHVSMWIRRRDHNGFPLPLKKIAATGLYSRRQVTAWWEQYQSNRSRGGALKREAARRNTQNPET